VVVVAPATAVAGAATTTEAQEGYALCGTHVRAKWLAVGGFSLFSGTATHARSEKIIAERAGLSALPEPGADHA
jgi:hypothetical protein